jgi:hypothetical protein
VYVVVPADAVETDGDHEPVIEFNEVVGNVGAASP